MTEQKPEKTARKKSLGFFVEGGGIFDKQMKKFAKEIILTLTRRLDNPNKKQVAELLGVQRWRLSRLLNGLGIEQKFTEIARKKRVKHQLNKKLTKTKK